MSGLETRHQGPKTVFCQDFDQAFMPIISGPGSVGRIPGARPRLPKPWEHPGTFCDVLVPLFVLLTNTSVSLGELSGIFTHIIDTCR
jgi:hypothetical protein